MLASSWLFASTEIFVYSLLACFIPTTSFSQAVRCCTMLPSRIDFLYTLYYLLFVLHSVVGFWYEWREKILATHLLLAHGLAPFLKLCHSWLWCFPGDRFLSDQLSMHVLALKTAVALALSPSGGIWFSREVWQSIALLQFFWHWESNWIRTLDHHNCIAYELNIFTGSWTSFSFIHATFTPSFLGFYSSVSSYCPSSIPVQFLFLSRIFIRIFPFSLVKYLFISLYWRSCFVSSFLFHFIPCKQWHPHPLALLFINAWHQKVGGLEGQTLKNYFQRLVLSCFVYFVSSISLGGMNNRCWATWHGKTVS